MRPPPRCDPAVLSSPLIHPEIASIPVILLSAKAQVGDIRVGLEAGADDYVTKPFEPLDLVDRVNALLNR